MYTVFPIQTLMSNQYLVQGEDGYLLIDAGMQIYFHYLKKQIKALGITNSLLKLAIITHADGDHYGSLSRIQEENPGTLITAASKPEADAIQKGCMSRELHPKPMEKWVYDLVSKLFTTPKARVDLLIDNGTKFEKFGIQVMETPGHTPGHISLWNQQEGILFCGDSILIHGKRVIPSSGANCWDEKCSRDSFDLQMALHPEVIYGGHGIWRRNHLET